MIRSLQWMPNTTSGWVDLQSDVMHRRAAGDRESKKRKPPLRIPARLLGHMRRWLTTDMKSETRVAHIIHLSGRPVDEQRRSWDVARITAGLGAEVTPHILRHTCATWMMQAGIDQWDAAGFLGMSPDMLWKVYGHHHPDFQRNLADKIGRR